KINLKRPWRRVKMADLVESTTGWKFDKRKMRESAPELYELYYHEKLPEEEEKWLEFARDVLGDRQPLPLHTIQKMRAMAEHVIEKLTPAEELVDLYERAIEPTLIDPTFVTHPPSVIVPLARENKEDPFYCDVYELAINGVEISPGYTELNDPDKQRAHFAHQ